MGKKKKRHTEIKARVKDILEERVKGILEELTARLGENIVVEPFPRSEFVEAYIDGTVEEQAIKAATSEIMAEVI
jgi:hypothetical protein